MNYKVTKPLWAVLVAMLPMLSAAQADAFEILHRHFRGAEETFRLSAGPMTIRLASWFVDDDIVRPILRRAKKARVVVSSDQNRIYTANLSALKRALQSENFEPLVEVRDGSDHIVLMIKEDKGYVRNIIALVHSDDGELVAVSVTCKISDQDLQDLVARSHKR